MRKARVLRKTVGREDGSDKGGQQKDTNIQHSTWSQHSTLKDSRLLTYLYLFNDTL